MPRDDGWTQPQPWLILAALGLSGPVHEASSTAALAAAQGILDRLPVGD